jgi:predicted lipid-binding transport protein (Tim44 family)
MTSFLKTGRTGFTLGFALLSVFLATALVTSDADARRLGGGKSFGKQSPTFNQRQALPPSKAAPAQEAGKPGQPPGATPAPAGNRWMGPLAGIAAGLGIGALLSHFGLGGAFAEGLGSMLVIALLIFAGVFIWRMLRRSTASPEPMRPMQQHAYAAPAPQPAASGRGVSVLGTPLPETSPAVVESTDAPWGVPADFDVAGFLRNAKVYFIRLQAAWDAKNLDDIREFTTPEVFAEIRMQLDEEKGAVNKTEVVNLDAKLLGIETGPTDYLATVRFAGVMHENQGEAIPFEEIWHLSKPVSGRGGWLLAGVQQVQ